MNLRIKSEKERKYLDSIEEKISLEDFIIGFVETSKMVGKYRLQQIVNYKCSLGLIKDENYSVSDYVFNKTLKNISDAILFECKKNEIEKMNNFYKNEYDKESKIANKAIVHVTISMAVMRRKKLEIILD